MDIETELERLPSLQWHEQVNLLFDLLHEHPSCVRHLVVEAWIKKNATAFWAYWEPRRDR